jgi:hypothetical protein
MMQSVMLSWRKMETNINDIKDLLEDRQLTHGDAWLIIGQYLSTMFKQGLLDKIFETPYCYAWVMEFAKLIRATQAPLFSDNPRDMAGYAQLVLNHITETQTPKPSQPPT